MNPRPSGPKPDALPDCATAIWNNRNIATGFEPVSPTSSISVLDLSRRSKLSLKTLLFQQSGVIGVIRSKFSTGIDRFYL